MNNHPPLILDSANVLAFAVVDNEVVYENRKTLPIIQAGRLMAPLNSNVDRLLWVECTSLF